MEKPLFANMLKGGSLARFHLFYNHREGLPGAMSFRT